MDEPAWHYIKSTTGCRYPRRHVFLHTRHVTTRTRRLYARTFSLAVAAFRSAPKGGKVTEYARAYDEPAQLWAEINAFVKPKSRVILWAHNLGYHARVAKAFVHLPMLGWRLIAWNVAPQGTWLVWQRDNSTITMVDSASVFPTTLAELSKHFLAPGTPPLPIVDDDRVEVIRCSAELGIMYGAIVSYLAWLERERLGNWQMTGTGQAFSAYKSRFMDTELLVHWDESARDLERRAMWTGRCEAFWHGTSSGPPVDEWDLSAAYPRIVHRYGVPTRLVKVVTTTDEVMNWLDKDGYAVLATVTVTTEVPVVPTMMDGRIAWPVGTFDTVLWDPELVLALDYAKSVNVTLAYVYRSEPALRGWAKWILSIIDSRDDDLPAWVRMIARHWSTAVIGRFAMQHQTWEHLGRIKARGIRWWTQKDMDTGTVSDLVQVGGDLWQSTGNQEWSNSMPAITGWVMSKCREIMTRLWLDLGDQVALYMDTDSLLVPRKHARLVATVAHENGYHGLRIKRSWNKVTIKGPRQIITEGRVRVSGVPVRAQPDKDGSLVGEVWESLRGALIAGRVAQVRITPRRWRLRDIDPRRAGGPDGWTEPIRLGS